MINDKKIVVVMPAFNAEKTLKRTLDEVPPIVDDCSSDNTAALAKNLGISHVIVHDRNRGYGGNQKTCYDTALSLGADIVVMVHPDYQYTPKLITAICSIIAYGVYPVVLGSRILGKGAIKGGMPRIKYVANRLLTLFQNILMGQKLSEYHTGYRAFSREVLENINYSADSEDFIFDNQMLAQVFYKGYEIGEVTCPTRYFGEASSINLKRSTVYGFGVLGVSVRYRLAKWGLVKPGYLA